MRSKPALLVFLVLAAVTGAPVTGADYERGRDLYDRHCENCHSAKVHGIQQPWHTDENQLRQIVNRWQLQQSLWWSSEDIEAVVYYLHITRQHD
jgi:hypothetical protein